MGSLWHLDNWFLWQLGYIIISILLISQLISYNSTHESIFIYHGVWFLIDEKFWAGEKWWLARSYLDYCCIGILFSGVITNGCKIGLSKFSHEDKRSLKKSMDVIRSFKFLIWANHKHIIPMCPFSFYMKNKHRFWCQFNNLNRHDSFASTGKRFVLSLPPVSSFDLLHYLYRISLIIINCFEIWTWLSLNVTGSLMGRIWMKRKKGVF